MIIRLGLHIKHALDCLPVSRTSVIMFDFINLDTVIFTHVSFRGGHLELDHDCVVEEKSGRTNRFYRVSNLCQTHSMGNQILFVTYTWLADVSVSVAKCLCF
jgi:hypothetical protein